MKDVLTTPGGRHVRLGIAAGLARALGAILSQPVDAHGVSSKDALYLLSLDGPAIIPLMYLGAKHMVTGYDHVLFLVGVITAMTGENDEKLIAQTIELGKAPATK